MEMKVPSMGESVTEAVIATIFKKDGDKVRLDEEILELETEKTNQALFANATGTLQLKVSQGQKVAIGDTVAIITEGEVAEPSPTPPPKKAEKVEKKEPPKSTPEGRETRQKLSRVREIIAKRLVEAQHTAALLTTFNEVDMSSVIEIRTKHQERFQEKYGTRLGFMSFFVKAVVEALKAVPQLNSYIDGDEIVQRHYFDLGVAVGTDRGVIVPVIKNCDTLSFAEIEIQLQNFAKLAKESKIAASDLSGGSFTISNGGVYGSLLSTPILLPPQAGILGMHKIEKRPVVLDDKIVIRQMMYLALTYDHRIVDGKEAITFLVKIKSELEDASNLLLGL